MLYCSSAPPGYRGPWGSRAQICLVVDFYQYQTIFFQFITDL